MLELKQPMSWLGEKAIVVALEHRNFVACVCVYQSRVRGCSGRNQLVLRLHLKAEFVACLWEAKPIFWLSLF